MCEPVRHWPFDRPWQRHTALTLRVVTAVAGGYTCTVALSSTVALSLVLLADMARSDAVLLASMLGFIIYLALLLWCFAEPRLWRVGLLIPLSMALDAGLQFGLTNI